MHLRQKLVISQKSSLSTIISLEDTLKTIMMKQMKGKGWTSQEKLNGCIRRIKEGKIHAFVRVDLTDRM